MYLRNIYTLNYVIYPLIQSNWENQTNLTIYSEENHAFKKISAFYFSQHLQKSISDWLMKEHYLATNNYLNELRSSARPLTTSECEPEAIIYILKLWIHEDLENKLLCVIQNYKKSVLSLHAQPSA